MSAGLIKFPYPLVVVRGEEAEAEWQRLARVGKMEGFSPVILGSEEEVERVGENMQFVEGSVEDILARAEKISAESWFSAKQAEFAGDEGEPEENEGDGGEEPQGSDRLTVPFDILSQQPHNKIYIARVPTVRSWEIPAYLKAGNWNECPPAEEQTAIFCYWHEQYGAEIACLSGDIVECIVVRPPLEKSAADKLAREQYLFCADIVWQGVGSMANLSKILIDSKYWYFWWD